MQLKEFVDMKGSLYNHTAFFLRVIEIRMLVE